MITIINHGYNDYNISAMLRKISSPIPYIITFR